MQTIKLVQYNILTKIYSLFFLTSSASVLIKNEKNIITVSNSLFAIDRETCLKDRLTLTNNKIKKLDVIYVLKYVSLILLTLFFLVGPFMIYTKATIPNWSYDILYFLAFCSSITYACLYLVDYSDSKINLKKYKTHLLNQLHNNTRFNRTPYKFENIILFQTLLNTKKKNILPLEIESINKRIEKDKSKDISINAELKFDIQPTALESEINMKSLKIRAEAKTPACLFHFLMKNDLIIPKRHIIKKEAKSFYNYHFRKLEDGSQFASKTISNQIRLIEKQESSVSDHYAKFIDYLKKYNNQYKVINSTSKFKIKATEYSELIYEPLLNSFDFEISHNLLMLILKLYFEANFTSKKENLKIIQLDSTEYKLLSKILTPKILN